MQGLLENRFQWLVVAERRSEALNQGWLIAAGAYPGFCSMKRLEVLLLPLDGMLVHRRSLPRKFARFPQQFAGTHLYTWVERGTVRVKCLAQEHNTMSPARARTRTARSGVERTNHEATAPQGEVLNSQSFLVVCSSLIPSTMRSRIRLSRKQSQKLHVLAKVFSSATKQSTNSVGSLSRLLKQYRS